MQAKRSLALAVSRRSVLHRHWPMKAGGHGLEVPCSYFFKGKKCLVDKMWIRNYFEARFEITAFYIIMILYFWCTYMYVHVYMYMYMPDSRVYDLLLVIIYSFTELVVVAVRFHRIQYIICLKVYCGQSCAYKRWHNIFLLSNIIYCATLIECSLYRTSCFLSRFHLVKSQWKSLLVGKGTVGYLCVFTLI